MNVDALSAYVMSTFLSTEAPSLKHVPVHTPKGRSVRFSRKERKQLEQERLELLLKLQRQMAEAAEMRFPNDAYQRGWLDALRYLNIPVRQSQGVYRNIPATRARQSNITVRSESTGNTAPDQPRA